MSRDEFRAALAAAMSTVDGVTGYVRRPTAPKVGDGWPLWRGSVRDEGYAFMETWAVVIAVGPNEVDADKWIEAHEQALFDALQSLLFVESFTPVAGPVQGNDALSLMITGRSE